MSATVRDAGGCYCYEVGKVNEGVASASRFVMYPASAILAKKDHVVGDMGRSLTRFTDMRHRVLQQTAAWEPYEKNRRGSLGVRDEQPPFLQPNVAIPAHSYRSDSNFPSSFCHLSPIEPFHLSETTSSSNAPKTSITPWSLGTAAVM
jgi:hypothetical protein